MADTLAARIIELENLAAAEGIEIEVDVLGPVEYALVIADLLDFPWPEAVLDIETPLAILRETPAPV